jgi:hypothetical protein
MLEKKINLPENIPSLFALIECNYKLLGFFHHQEKKKKEENALSTRLSVECNTAATRKDNSQNRGI